MLHFNALKAIGLMNLMLTLQIIVTFRDNILDLGYDGKNCSAMDDPDGPGYQWNFAGALLFSVTVITTIGRWMEITDLSQSYIFCKEDQI